jgi:K+ transporter
MGCVGVVLWFRESANMEGAYGLAITMTMLMMFMTMMATDRQTDFQNVALSKQISIMKF